jgi:hypothetical protein
MNAICEAQQRFAIAPIPANLEKRDAYGTSEADRTIPYSLLINQGVN